MEGNQSRNLKQTPSQPGHVILFGHCSHCSLSLSLSLSPSESLFVSVLLPSLSLKPDISRAELLSRRPRRIVGGLNHSPAWLSSDEWWVELRRWEETWLRFQEYSTEFVLLKRMCGFVHFWGEHDLMCSCFWSSRGTALTFDGIFWCHKMQHASLAGWQQFFGPWSWSTPCFDPPVLPQNLFASLRVPAPIISQSEVSLLFRTKELNSDGLQPHSDGLQPHSHSRGRVAVRAECHGCFHRAASGHFDLDLVVGGWTATWQKGKSGRPPNGTS